MTRHFEEITVIHAPPAAVWKSLTDPELMKQWMGEPSMAVHIETDWTVGGPVTVSGFHHARFENRGTVLSFEAEKLLRYSQLSSLSRLPDKPENHSVLAFELVPVPEGTSLRLTVSGFPDDVIFKHLDFYWRGTLRILKQFVEKP